ncbi:MAG: S41 family peptidase [Arcobacteraceae bacterium]|nr:S41 family peptidase [Arcobacteraceae bacterium]
MKKLLILLLTATLSFSQTVKEEEKVPTRLESYGKLQQVIGAVERIYVDDIKLDEIVDKAIKGLMQELDAHSSHMDKKYFKEFKVQMKGEFGGLGIVVGMRDGALTIISPIDDTPASKAGVESGDIILKIDDKSTLKMTLNDAVTLMRGKVGTPIDITVVRKEALKPIKIHIVRGIIKVKSVSYKTLGDILYLRIASFDNNVAKQLIKIIKEHKEKTKGIILDLRNNPGGSLAQSIKTVDLFVDKGIIVSQKGRDPKQDKHYDATKEATLTKVQMVVLVNGGSASASEIVSGALQDHKRAVIVGEKTFGKGSVQVVLPLNDVENEAIKLTIAKYYLPSGRTIQAKGVTPDIESFRGEAVKEKDDEFSIKEKDLKKHLEVELEKVNGTKKEDKKKEKKDNKIINEEDLYKDNQLKTAADILKALILIGEK